MPSENGIVVASSTRVAINNQAGSIFYDDIAFADEAAHHAGRHVLEHERPHRREARSVPFALRQPFSDRRVKRIRICVGAARERVLGQAAGSERRERRGELVKN